MRYFGLFSLATIIVLLSIPDARAQSSRLYFAGYLGLASVPDQGYSEGVTPTSGDIEFDNTPSFAAAMGVRISKNLRLEAELSTHKSDLNAIRTGGGTFDMAGELRTYALLLNGYYDFDWDLGWPVEPYISAGIGLAQFDGDFEDTAGVTINESGDDIGFIWQFGSGLKYRLNPDLAFTGGYRYLNAADIELDRASVEYSNHEFRIGLEYDIPVK